jgi:nucleoside-diphosphate-sugar epimerase
MPQLAWLAPEFDDICTPDRFVQADASREQTLGRIFDRGEGKGEFDYVFNCGGEMRFSQPDEVYKARLLQPSLVLGAEAAKRKVKCFVELSTGMVYKPDQVPRKETDKLKPWLNMATFKLQAEEQLAKIEGLNLLILRLPHVYGEYSSKYVATALTMARIYQYLEKEMSFLWDKNLRINTIHVSDLSRALWHAASWFNDGKKNWKSEWGKVPVFNVVDNGNTCTSPFICCPCLSFYFKHTH